MRRSNSTKSKHTKHYNKPPCFCCLLQNLARKRGAWMHSTIHKTIQIADSLTQTEVTYSYLFRRTTAQKTYKKKIKSNNKQSNFYTNTQTYFPSQFSSPLVKSLDLRHANDYSNTNYWNSTMNGPSAVSAFWCSCNISEKSCSSLLRMMRSKYLQPTNATEVTPCNTFIRHGIRFPNFREVY